MVKCQIPNWYTTSTTLTGPESLITVSRHSATARMKWNKQVNIVITVCYYLSRPSNENGVPIRGYRQRMYMKWMEY